MNYTTIDRYDNSHLISNPLLISMAVEIYQENLNVTSLNLYEFFELYVNYKFDKVCKVKDKERIKEAHQDFAIYFLFGLDEFIFRFSSNREIGYNLKYDGISSCEILKINSKKDFEFSHSKFAEFFVTQFLFENINEMDTNSEYASVEAKIFSYALNKIDRAFIDDFMNSTNSSHFVRFWHENFQQFFGNADTRKHEGFYKLLDDIFLSYYFEKNFNETCETNMFGKHHSLTPILFECNHFHNDLFLFQHQNFKTLHGDELYRYALTYTSIYDGKGLVKCPLENLKVDSQKMYQDILIEVKYFTKTDIERLFFKPKDGTESKSI